MQDLELIAFTLLLEYIKRHKNYILVNKIKKKNFFRTYFEYL